MFLSKIFEGEMFIRILPTTLLQIFCENLFYFQVIFKSMKIADDTFLETQSVNGLGSNEKPSDTMGLYMQTLHKGFKAHEFSIKELFKNNNVNFKTLKCIQNLILV